VASSLLALLGVAGYTLSDSAAVEIAGVLVTVGANVAIWLFRVSKPDVTALGTRK